MAPQPKRPAPASSREVRQLLRRADRLFAEGAKLQSLAKKALVQHFRQGAADEPSVDDRIKRAPTRRKTRKTRKK